MEGLAGSGPIHLDIKHALGDDTSVSRPGNARVLDRMLEIEQHPRCGPGIALIDEHRPSPQQIAMTFNDEVERRVQQWMPGANKGRRRLALRRDKRLLKHDALISRLHRFAEADQAVAVAHRRWNMRHLEATGF